MTNVKISAKGQAFLSKENSAMELARAIATTGSKLSSKNGVVMQIGGRSVSARSVVKKAV
jgi:hypothetical protein